MRTDEKPIPLRSAEDQMRILRNALLKGPIVKCNRCVFGLIPVDTDFMSSNNVCRKCGGIGYMNVTSI